MPERQVRVRYLMPRQASTAASGRSLYVRQFLILGDVHGWRDAATGAPVGEEPSGEQWHLVDLWNTRPEECAEYVARARRHDQDAAAPDPGA